jgi:hypothetical protein
MPTKYWKNTRKRTSSDIAKNVERLDQLERESTRRMNALEVQMARINRGGKHSGPDYVAS